jgi:uncharacterized membrane protein
VQHSGERLFQTGLWIKGINGALELIGGALAVLVPHGFFLRTAGILARNQSGREPLDSLDALLVQGLNHLGDGNRGFLVFYLLSHGVLKIFIAVSLVRHWRPMAPVAVIVLVALIAYELYRLVAHPGILIGGVVGVDLLILVLVLHHLKHFVPRLAKA